MVEGLGHRARGGGWSLGGLNVSLRVQVPKNHILTQNLYHKLLLPKTKYLIIGYLDPLGLGCSSFGLRAEGLGFEFPYHPPSFTMLNPKS